MTPRHARGFSLMELVIVIVIGAILAAIAIPMFNQPEIDAAWYQEQVRSALRHAQRTAVAQRRPVYVVVEAAPTRVSLCYAAGCGAGTRLPQPGSTSSFEVVAPSGVALGISASPLFFNGLGQPSSGATVTVGPRTITVNAETGYVQ
jgi:MSHA pilin protein MshC